MFKFRFLVLTVLTLTLGLLVAWLVLPPSSAWGQPQSVKPMAFESFLARDAEDFGAVPNLRQELPLDTFSADAPPESHDPPVVRMFDGVVLEHGSQEPVVGAIVELQPFWTIDYAGDREEPLLRAISDADGRFSLSLPVETFRSEFARVSIVNARKTCNLLSSVLPIRQGHEFRVHGVASPARSVTMQMSCSGIPSAVPATAFLVASKGPLAKWAPIGTEVVARSDFELRPGPTSFTLHGIVRPLAHIRGAMQLYIIARDSRIPLWMSGYASFDELRSTADEGADLNFYSTDIRIPSLPNAGLPEDVRVDFPNPNAYVPSAKPIRVPDNGIIRVLTALDHMTISGYGEGGVCRAGGAYQVGERFTWHYDAPGPHVVEVLVRDGHGEPIESAMVMYRIAEGVGRFMPLHRGWRGTDADGRVFLNVYEGVYSLDVAYVPRGGGATTNTSLDIEVPRSALNVVLETSATLCIMPTFFGQVAPDHLLEMTALVSRGSNEWVSHALGYPRGYRISGLAPGYHRLIVASAGLYGDVDLTLPTAEGMHVVQVPMRPMESVEGYVGESDGTPVGGASVSIGDSGPEFPRLPWQSAVSDDRGEFRLQYSGHGLRRLKVVDGRRSVTLDGFAGAVRIVLPK